MSTLSSYKDVFGSSFYCECGKHHTIPLKDVVIKQEAVEEIPLILNRENLGKCGLMVCDDNTWALAGRRIAEILPTHGYDIKVCMLTQKPIVKPDEKAITQILLEFEPSMDFLIAVGSGTINDLTRFISHRTGKPYIVFATAPSMDGYASTVSPLLINGFKRTYITVHPLAIIADIDMLCSAPADMILAGFGDILGKVTSLADWQLGVILAQEKFCPIAKNMVQKALEEVISRASLINQRKPEGIQALMEALILSGTAMMLVGNSRPASGSEHHISHYIEMKYFMEGRQPLLHGTKVGLATLYTVALYNQLASLDPENIDIPQLMRTRISYEEWCQKINKAFGPIAQEVIDSNNSQNWDAAFYERRLHDIKEKWETHLKPLLSSVPQLDMVKEWLHKARANFTPQALGIEQNLVEEALLYAKEIRPLYTILRLADDLGILEEKIKKIISLV
jgi:glycerol-1-phosphate dehydrogenase [NAD(P)+]